jgi:hypothetical protein
MKDLDGFQKRVEFGPMRHGVVKQARRDLDAGQVIGFGVIRSKVDPGCKPGKGLAKIAKGLALGIIG